MHNFFSDSYDSLLLISLLITSKMGHENKNGGTLACLEVLGPLSSLSLQIWVAMRSSERDVISNHRFPTCVVSIRGLQGLWVPGGIPASRGPWWVRTCIFRDYLHPHTLMSWTGSLFCAFIAHCGSTAPPPGCNVALQHALYTHSLVVSLWMAPVWRGLSSGLQPQKLPSKLAEALHPSSRLSGGYLQGSPGERGPEGFPGMTVCSHDRFTKVLAAKLHRPSFWEAVLFAGEQGTRWRQGGSRAQRRQSRSHLLSVYVIES